MLCMIQSICIAIVYGPLYDILGTSGTFESWILTTYMVSQTNIKHPGYMQLHVLSNALSYLAFFRGR